MDLFDIAVARKLAGGGGGGGSSDFSKAVVTVDTHRPYSSTFTIMPFTMESAGEFVSAFMFGANGVVGDAEYNYDAQTTKTDTYYIYKNTYMIGYNLEFTDPSIYSITGNAEAIFDEAAGFVVVKIMGDCTIAYSN